MDRYPHPNQQFIIDLQDAANGDVNLHRWVGDESGGTFTMKLMAERPGDDTPVTPDSYDPGKEFADAYNVRYDGVMQPDEAWQRLAEMSEHSEEQGN